MSPVTETVQKAASYQEGDWVRVRFGRGGSQFACIVHVWQGGRRYSVRKYRNRSGRFTKRIIVWPDDIIEPITNKLTIEALERAWNGQRGGEGWW